MLDTQKMASELFMNGASPQFILSDDPRTEPPSLEQKRNAAEWFGKTIEKRGSGLPITIISRVTQLDDSEQERKQCEH